MTAPFFLCIHGSLVITGYEPDGDSVRFIADDRERFRELKRADRLRPSRQDGSVQLRFEGVDAPELHYGQAAQPLGATARDFLLGRIGFTEVKFEKPQQPNRVTGATPDRVRAAILAQMVEVNGRPVAYVVVADGHALPKDGAWVEVGPSLLDETLNLQLLVEGQAYYTVYTSTPLNHRQHLHGVTEKARAGALGVWAQDTTADFALVDQSSIGPGAQLILPKLFRRCTDFLKALAGGFSGNLVDWLLASSQTPSRNENDRVLLRDTTEVHLSDLLQQRNQHIAFQADLLDLTFVEK